jgi:hypothetical protein
MLANAIFFNDGLLPGSHGGPLFRLAKNELVAKFKTELDRSLLKADAAPDGAPLQGLHMDNAPSPVQLSHKHSSNVRAHNANWTHNLGSPNARKRRRLEVAGDVGTVSPDLQSLTAAQGERDPQNPVAATIEYRFESQAHAIALPYRNTAVGDSIHG